MDKSMKLAAKMLGLSPDHFATEEKPNQKETVKIQRDKQNKYFGREVSAPQKQATILRLLEQELIRQQKKRDARDSR